MNTCGDCEFAHVVDPRDLRIRTCYGEPPQIVEVSVQVTMPNNPLDPEAPPRQATQRQLIPLRPQVAATDYACRHWRAGRRVGRLSEVIEEMEKEGP
jgi:hypothetical protein